MANTPKEIRTLRTIAGICGYCGKNPLASGSKSQCEACKAKQRVYSKKAQRTTYFFEDPTHHACYIQDPDQTGGGVLVYTYLFEAFLSGSGAWRLRESFKTEAVDGRERWCNIEWEMV